MSVPGSSLCGHVLSEVLGNGRRSAALQELWFDDEKYCPYALSRPLVTQSFDGT